MYYLSLDTFIRLFYMLSLIYIYSCFYIYFHPLKKQENTSFYGWSDWKVLALLGLLFLGVSFGALAILCFWSLKYLISTYLALQIYCIFVISYLAFVITFGLEGFKNPDKRVEVFGVLTLIWIIAMPFSLTIFLLIIGHKPILFTYLYPPLYKYLWLTIVMVLYRIGVSIYEGPFKLSDNKFMSWFQIVFLGFFGLCSLYAGACLGLDLLPKVLAEENEGGDNSTIEVLSAALNEPIPPTDVAADPREPRFSAKGGASNDQAPSNPEEGGGSDPNSININEGGGNSTIEVLSANINEPIPPTYVARDPFQEAQALINQVKQNSERIDALEGALQNQNIERAVEEIRLSQEANNPVLLEVHQDDIIRFVELVEPVVPVLISSIAVAPLLIKLAPTLLEHAGPGLGPKVAMGAAITFAGVVGTHALRHIRTLRRYEHDEEDPFNDPKSPGGTPDLRINSPREEQTIPNSLEDVFRLAEQKTFPNSLEEFLGLANASSSQLALHYMVFSSILLTMINAVFALIIMFHIILLAVSTDNKISLKKLHGFCPKYLCDLMEDQLNSMLLKSTKIRFIGLVILALVVISLNILIGYGLFKIYPLLSFYKFINKRGEA